MLIAWWFGLSAIFLLEVWTNSPLSTLGVREWGLQSPWCTRCVCVDVSTRSASALRPSYCNPITLLTSSPVHSLLTTPSLPLHCTAAPSQSCKFACFSDPGASMQFGRRQVDGCFPHKSPVTRPFSIVVPMKRFCVASLQHPTRHPTPRRPISPIEQNRTEQKFMSSVFCRLLQNTTVSPRRCGYKWSPAGETVFHTVAYCFRNDGVSEDRRGLYHIGWRRGERSGKGENEGNFEPMQLRKSKKPMKPKMKIKGLEAK